MNTTIQLKPSYIVSLKTSVTGGISYRRVDIEHQAGEEEDITKWETTRVIDNKEEYESAIKVRGAVVNEIKKVAKTTSFGLLCPVEKADELAAVINTAKEMAAEFNSASKYTKVGVYILKGEVSSSDEDALRALSAEVAELINEMDQGIKNLDVNAIRAAATKANQVVGTLADEQANVLNDAIAQARKAARTIVKRIEKKGELADVVLSEIKQNDLAKARAAFLDISEQEEITETTIDPNQAQRAAQLDINDTDTSTEEPAEQTVEE